MGVLPAFRKTFEDPASDSVPLNQASRKDSRLLVDLPNHID
jgi:hypothetical protein